MTAARPLRDAAERARAEEVGCSFWVEAPAGAGKTSLLVARYLRLLAAADPAEILALTFTNKAAGEMRDRIAALLEAAARGARGRDEREQHLLDLAGAALSRHADQQQLLRSAGPLRVMTFHGFCHLLVRSAPAEARVPLQAAVLEEVDQRLLRREVVRRALHDLLAEPAPARRELRGALERRLLRLNNRFDLLEAELGELLARRDLFEDLALAVAASAGAGLEEVLAGRLRAVLERRLQRLRCSLEQTDLAAHLGELPFVQRGVARELEVELAAQLPEARWEGLPAWRALAEVALTRSGTPRRRWTGRKLMPALAAALEKLPEQTAAQLHAVRDLPDADSPLLEPGALLDLLRLGQALIDIHQEALRLGGGLDFVELERAALRVLSDGSPGALQLHLGARIEHLLVDEFQDTSRMQWEIIRRLCAGWRPGDGRTLFVVGDPKQSIYAFRKAEVSLFLLARGGVDGLPLEPLSLSTNFRSSPALLRWCNGFFGELLEAPDSEAEEVGFSPGTPPADEPDLAARVRLALFSPAEDEEPGDDARRREAAWIAATIAELLEEHASSPLSIAILPFTRSPMQHYLAACAAAGIRLQVKEGLLIKDTPEGAHLLNLCRALARPHDDFAWASLLRAPWTWQPMALLARLPRAASWRERLLEGRALHPELETMMAALEQAGRGLGRRPLADLCREVWEAVDGPAACVRLRGLQGVENVRRVLTALDEAEQGSPLATLAQVEARLQSLYEPPDPAAADSPVWMMTVHGAKGLEFDAVFVPQLDRDPTSRPPEARLPPYLLERSVEGPLMAVQPDRRLGEGEALYEVLGDLARRRLIGEAKRLLYVAMTRARRHLFLSGLVRPSGKEKRDLAARHRQSYLTWVMAHERIHTRADAESGATGRNRVAVELDPRPARPGPVAAPGGAVELPAPASLDAEAPPYRLAQPSSAATGETPMYAVAPAEEDQRARGLVVHALLERAAIGEPLPGADAVRAALIEHGLAPGEAEAMAAGLLDEVRTCLAEPFLSGLLALPPHARRAEWRLEAQRSGGAGVDVIWSGSIDLVADDGRCFWLLDYKTTRRDEAVSRETFDGMLRERYRHQLGAYREMLAKLRDLSPEQVKVGLYLTAEARWLEM